MKPRDEEGIALTIALVIYFALVWGLFIFLAVKSQS
jgi:hypothetical protein